MKHLQGKRNLSSGKSELLRTLVTDGKFAQMNSELKKIKEVGRMEWISHGSASRPKLLQILVAEAELPTGKSKVCQATVQVQVRQVWLVHVVGWYL
jgi:hypothetical protein